MISKIKNSIKNFLIYTQRFTHLDNIYLAKGTFWLWLANLISIGLGFILVIVFARFADKVVFGQYQFFLAVLGTMVILAMPGANTAIMESVARGKSKSFFLAFQDRLRFSLLGSLALVILALFYFSSPDQAELGLVFLMAALFFPASEVLNSVYTYYFATKNVKIPSIFHILVRLVSVTAVVIAVLVFKNIFWISLGYIASVSLVNFIAYFYLRKKEKFEGEADPTVVSYGRKMTLLGVIPKVANNFDQLALPFFLGFAGLANYIIAIKLTDTAKGFLNLLDRLYFPKFVHFSKAKLIERLKNPFIYLVLVAIIITLIITLPFFITLFFGHQYLEVIGIAQIYTLVLMPKMFQRMIKSWAAARRATKVYFHITNSWGVVSILTVIAVLFFYRSLYSLILARVLIGFAGLIFTVIILKFYKDSN